MNQETWNSYASAWAEPNADKRLTILNKVLAEGFSYKDPNAEKGGRQELSDYMAGFQANMPGHRFTIDKVVSHHDRCISIWRLVNADGKTQQHGASFAHCDDDGRLQQITGFFDTDVAR